MSTEIQKTTIDIRRKSGFLQRKEGHLDFFFSIFTQIEVFDQKTIEIIDFIEINGCMPNNGQLLSNDIVVSSKRPN